MKSYSLPLPGLLCLVCLTATAQDFRMDTEVLVGDEKKPVVETLTLFSEGQVYDFLLPEPREITVFDPRMGQFTLLDPVRKQKTIITLQEVVDNCISLNLHAADSTDPFFKFAARPQFDVTEETVKHSGRDGMRVTLKSSVLEYKVIGTPPELPAAAVAFRQFADAQTRLNALFAGGMLPEPRIQLNRELADRGLLPDEITRVILPTSRFQKPIEVRSRHLKNWILSKLDKEKIELVGTYKVTFESVPFEKYRDALRQAPDGQQAKR